MGGWVGVLAPYGWEMLAGGKRARECGDDCLVLLLC